MPLKVLITEPIVESVIKKMRDKFSVDVGERGVYSEEKQLMKAVSDYHALLTMLSNPVTKEVVKAGKNLRVIANHAVGHNNIDLKAAKKAGIKVANTPGVLTQSSADGAMALLLNAARKICDAQSYLRQGKFNGWEPLGFLGMELNGKKLGILGMGRIGTALARRAKAFGMDLIYHNRSRVSPELEEELEARYVESINQLAKKSDILSINCPLTEDSRHIVSAEVLSVMPEHAILINTARGPIVHEEALGEALHSRSIAGAGIDVFEKEPDIHPRLLSAPNCILTPHIASATRETRTAMGLLAADAIIGILEGKDDAEIPNLIRQ